MPECDVLLMLGRSSGRAILWLGFGVYSVYLFQRLQACIGTVTRVTAAPGIRNQLARELQHRGTALNPHNTEKSSHMNATACYRDDVVMKQQA
jgi:hypothetical protein